VLHDVGADLMVFAFSGLVARCSVMVGVADLWLQSREVQRDGWHCRFVASKVQMFAAFFRQELLRGTGEIPLGRQPFNFFLIFNAYYASVPSITEAVMEKYASGHNRGRKLIPF